MSCPTAGWICSDVLLTSSANLRQMFCWLESHAQGGIKRVSASFLESTGSGHEYEWASPAGGAVSGGSVTDRTASPSCARFPQSRTDLAGCPPRGRSQREPHMDRGTGARDRPGRIGRSLV